MQFLPLPAYRPASPLDFSGLAGAFDNARRNRLAEAGLQLQRDQFGLQQERFGLEKARHPLELTQMQAAIDSSRGAESRAQGMHPLQMGQMQAQTDATRTNALLARAQIEASRGAEGRAQGMHPLQIQTAQANLQQARMQTPEARRQALIDNGIDPRTPAAQGFILNGQYAPPSATDDLIRGFAGQVAPPSGGGPAIGRTPPVVPQSFDGGTVTTDPNLIRTQATGAGAPPPPNPSMVQTPIGLMTPERARQLGFGLAIAGRGEAGKMLTEEANKFDLGKEAANENDKRELAAVEGLYRLRTIAQGFKPEWQTYEQGMKQRLVGWADSFESLRGKLKPDELQRHVEFVQFKRDATAYLTEGIKAATGAAMGIQEEARIRAGLPDPQKDGPTAFAAKLQSTQRDLELTVMRTRYLRQNGFRGMPWRGDGSAAEKALPVDQFRRIMNERKEQLYQDLRRQQPQAPREELIPIVGQMLNREFGI